MIIRENMIPLTFLAKNQYTALIQVQRKFYQQKYSEMTLYFSILLPETQDF